MKKIPLVTGGHALVSDKDYPKLKGYKWREHHFTVHRTTTKNGKRTTILMHRVIMDFPEGKEVDHINGNWLDNRRSNLRVCTRLQNCANRKLNKNSTSGYKGVSWHKHKKKYHAYIRRDGKDKHLGYYTDKGEAAKAYDRAAQKLFGKFAKLNFGQGS